MLLSNSQYRRRALTTRSVLAGIGRFPNTRRSVKIAREYLSLSFVEQRKSHRVRHRRFPRPEGGAFQCTAIVGLVSRFRLKCATRVRQFCAVRDNERCIYL